MPSASFNLGTRCSRGENERVKFNSKRNITMRLMILQRGLFSRNFQTIFDCATDSSPSGQPGRSHSGPRKPAKISRKHFDHLFREDSFRTNVRQSWRSFLRLRFQSTVWDNSPSICSTSPRSSFLSRSRRLNPIKNHESLRTRDGLQSLH